MKTIETLGAKGKRTSFNYEGSVSTGVTLIFETTTAQIDASFFSAALKQFAGKTVQGGFKMDDPPTGGFGEWVRNESGQLNSRSLDDSCAARQVEDRTNGPR
jgi:hypothetical protein